MYNCGLVLEGGGNRGIFTSGVLDAFLDNGIQFPYVIGVSMGSCNGVSFLGKCRRRQHDMIIKYGNDKRYMSLNSLRKNGEYMNSEWLFGELSYDILPLNQEEFENSGAVMCIPVTNTGTGKPEYMYPKSMREYGCPIVRASCSMPLATKGTDIDGVTYFDGGVTDSIPLRHALEDGCQKAVVILTQDKLYLKKPLKENMLINRMLKKYPLLKAALLNRHNMYNEQRRYVDEQEINGTALVIRPPKPLDCSSIEKDTNKLEVIYQMGYQQGLKHIDEVKNFIAE